MPKFHAHSQVGITHLFLVLATQVGGFLQIECRNLLLNLILCKTLVLSLLILLFLRPLFFLSFLLQLLSKSVIYLDSFKEFSIICVLLLLVLLFLGPLFLLSFLLELLSKPFVYLDGFLDAHPVENNNYGKVDCEVKTN